MKHPFSLGLALLILCIVPISHVQAESTFISSSDNNGNAAVSEPIHDDAFLVGNTIGIDAPVAGEIFAAGNVVNISKLGGRSVYAAGNVVNLDQGSGYNAFVAGNTVTLSGTYGHDVYAAGNSVTVKAGTVIEGDLRIAGSVVNIAGTVKGNVYASGGKVTSSSVIGGNFSGDASTYTFLGGSIAGNLNYQSKDTAIGLDKVSISGKTERTDPPQSKNTSAYTHTFGWLISFLSTYLLGAFLILLMPRKIIEQLDIFKNERMKQAGIGVSILILTPIAAALAFATIIGWKIGLIIIAIYTILLLISYVIAAIWLGQFILERLKRNGSLWFNLLIGLASISLVSAIPWIGWIIAALFFLGFVLPSFGSLVENIRKAPANS